MQQKKEAKTLLFEAKQEAPISDNGFNEYEFVEVPVDDDYNYASFPNDFTPSDEIPIAATDTEWSYDMDQLHQIFDNTNESSVYPEEGFHSSELGLHHHEQGVYPADGGFNSALQSLHHADEGFNRALQSLHHADEGFNRALQSLHHPQHSHSSEQVSHHSKEGFHHSEEGFHHSEEGFHHTEEGFHHPEVGFHHSEEGFHHLEGGFHHLEEGFHHSEEGFHHLEGGFHHLEEGFHHSEEGFHHPDGGFHHLDEGFHHSAESFYHPEGGFHHSEEGFHHPEAGFHHPGQALNHSDTVLYHPSQRSLHPSHGSHYPEQGVHHYQKGPCSIDQDMLLQSESTDVTTSSSKSMHKAHFSSTSGSSEDDPEVQMLIRKLRSDETDIEEHRPMQPSAANQTNSVPQVPPHEPQEPQENRDHAGTSTGLSGRETERDLMAEYIKQVVDAGSATRPEGAASKLKVHEVIQIILLNSTYGNKSKDLRRILTFCDKEGHECAAEGKYFKALDTETIGHIWVKVKGNGKPTYDTFARAMRVEHSSGYFAFLASGKHTKKRVYRFGKKSMEDMPRIKQTLKPFSVPQAHA